MKHQKQPKQPTKKEGGAGTGTGTGLGISIVPESASPFSSVHGYVSELNNSAIFAGLVMLIMNVGSKYVQLNLSESTEEYLKHILKKEILVFAIAWMGTRNIYYSLIITACFIIIADHLTNEESEYCILPQHIRERNKETGEVKKSTEFVSDVEINRAIGVLEKAKRQKEREKNEALLKKHNFFELA
jgi:DNA integrity scanning protein DisA with diadenylate cyclase activity